MNAKSPQPTNSATEGIAVIGIAGRFPGADDVVAFWQNLVNGVSGVTDVSPKPESSLPQHPNYVAKAAVVKDADHFDAKFFGIYPTQAVEMDPQHRLFLEASWHAMEDAGYIPDESKVRVGVFAGCHMNTYIFTRVAADAELRRSLADSFPGGSLTAEISNDKDYLATRVAFQLNLRGPCVAVQSACSTSLVAIAQACENLTAGSCDMAIAGGVTVTFPQEQGYLHTEDSILSPDGTCRTFDASACGTIFGDGVGAVVLKRLPDAVSDRDDIYGVIRGWGVNNDGSNKLGYTAPSVDGQRAAIRLAHQRAGITADSVTYVEAHGTGTLVGDPIEIQALTKAFRETTEKRQFCRIGSLKTNIGHSDVAAGVAGVIKTCLALKHRQLPPTLHFKTPNPNINFRDSPFIVNDQLTPWKTESLPRRAGVSSFGIGGTNAHVVLEEAPDVAGSRADRPCYLLRLSARSITSLDQMSDDLAGHLSEDPHLNLADVSYTLHLGRKSFDYKRIVVASDLQEAADSFRQRSTKQSLTVCGRASDTPVAFLFPGQGAQHLNMARELYRSEPVFAKNMNDCAESLNPHLDVDLRALVDAPDGDPEAGRIHQTEIAQPTLFMVSFALGRWWQSLGVHPTVLIGHSVGEFAAAAIAGVMSMEDAARLVALRGRLMQSLPLGSMMAVQMRMSELRPLLDESLEIAAINGPEFCVISGPTDAVEAFASAIEVSERENVACRKLQTSHAFHSRMMDAAINPFEQAVRQVKLRPPSIPMVSSVTADTLDDVAATDPVYWARQIREPVQFSGALERILTRGDDSLVLLEVGPSHTLSTLARQQPIDPKRHHIVASLPHAKQRGSDARFALTSLGRLWQHGVSIDWQSVFANQNRRRVHLPAYRFQRERYSFDTDWGERPNYEQPLEPNAANTDSLAQTVISQQMQLMASQMKLLHRTKTNASCSSVNEG